MDEKSSFDQAALPGLLYSYYKRIFPYKSYCKWLSYGRASSDSFVKREFAFILEGDAYLRHHSFRDQHDFEKSVLSVCPHKIDIGAVFSHRPKDHKIVQDYAAVERELVFDIDMTDYDDVRTCCSGGSMCKKCWKFIVIAVKILDKALSDDFGFQHRLWVFSGRRGVHCWVCDKAARKLSSLGRNAVAEYLTLLTGGANQGKKVKLTKQSIHPSVKRASATIRERFGELAEEQGWLDGPEQWKEILKLVPDQESSVQTRWKKLLFRFQPPSTDKWKPPPPSCKWLLEEILIQLAYPRLDINVTKGLNHLLKSPFCVHPKTGKVAVPFDAAHVDSFNPDTVPRIDQIMADMSRKSENVPLAENKEVNGTNRKQLDINNSLLADYVRHFNKFVESVVAAENDEKPRDTPSLQF